jgi:hypothetical protein
MTGHETGLYSWVYAVGHACLIICQVMSALTFMAVMLAERLNPIKGLPPYGVSLWTCTGNRMRLRRKVLSMATETALANQ